MPGTRAGAEATVGKDVTAEVEHEEDATGNELSKLFLLRRGDMANDKGK